ncbi:TOBE domain-containing protein [Azomonas macrocytogenes]|uniref:Molybdate transport system regulatory protein n=1 Tax=Azomonas macrocytogenes TaxID=69962 RepID=A0A839T2Z5_AZOMA|nr:TOBE domain-containing protein [Azomonas macrocytogenes]MBB3103911.1 molybdate transport system regulatory protein [Azomonas macrocytogenes]
MSQLHRPKPSESIGEFWPEKRDKNRMASKSIELLEQIEMTGSISRAAKKIKLPYKAAWDTVDAMSNLSERPLVVCSAGGLTGGTRLTDFGREVVQTWRRMQVEYERYLAKIAQGVEHFEDIDRLLRAITTKTSAGNQFHGRIKTIEQGAIDSCVSLDLGEGLEIVATMTNECADDLQLTTGKAAIALVKASFILLSPDPELKISARNRLQGKLIAIIPGTISSEVKIQLPKGRTLTATVTNESVSELGLAPGQPCTAFIKASHVIIST